MVHSCQLRVYKIVTIAVAHFKIMLSLSVIVLIFLFLVMLHFSKRAQYVLTILLSSYYALQ